MILNYGNLALLFNQSSEQLTFPQNIDLSLIIRGIAALFVVWWHHQGFKGEIFSFINIPGRISVWIFFIISGYVIAYSFANKLYDFTISDVLRFYKARLLRIVPLFWLVSFCSLFTSIILKADLPPLNILSEFFALQWNHSYTLSGVFWTLGIELQFYFIAPLLAFGLMVNKNNIKFGVAVFAIFLAWPLISRLIFNANIDNRTTLGNMSHFVIGMIAATSLTKFEIEKYFAWLAIIFSLILIMIASHLYHMNIKLFFAGTGALLVDCAGLLILVAHRKFEDTSANPKNYLLTTSYTFGILSYGIYAWHSYLIRYFPAINSDFFILLAVSVLLAYVSYSLIEQPMLSFKSKKPQV